MHIFHKWTKWEYNIPEMGPRNYFQWRRCRKCGKYKQKLVV